MYIFKIMANDNIYLNNYQTKNKKYVSFPSNYLIILRYITFVNNLTRVNDQG
jgi:hypothetical protein